MISREQHLDIKDLPTLSRLLVDDINLLEHTRENIMDNIFYHWVDPTQDLSLVVDLIKSFSGTSFADEIAQRLLQLIRTANDEVIERTIPLLSAFPDTKGTTTFELIELVMKRTGTIRWLASVELSKLGMEDDRILHNIKRGNIQTVKEISSHLQIQEPLEVFNQEEFHRLYAKALLDDSTTSEKGTTLEDLAEYLFSCVPGLAVFARDLRTITAEIDLSIINNASGFWQEVGNPFIVECRNRKETIDAKSIRDLSGKLSIQGIRSAFLVTTNHLTRDAKFVIWNLLSDNKFIIAIDKDCLEKIESGEKLEKVLSDCFYVCRFL